MERFYTNLRFFLNISVEQAKTLVTNFETGDLVFFQTYFDALPPATFSVENDKNAAVNSVLYVEEENIGAGGFGIIKKNKTRPFVYKSLENKYYLSNPLIYLKSIFQEAIIQTLLQSDSSHGIYICKLYRLYRAGPNTCIFQMESLMMTTLGKFIRDKEESYLANPEPLNKMLQKKLIKILEIINYFNTSYGFSHNDLSLENIMIHRNNIKLIDFGLSSVNFGTIQIGKKIKSRTDQNYLCSKLATYLDINPNEFSKYLETLAMMPPETPIQTYITMLKSQITKSQTAKKSQTKKAQTKKTKKLKST